MNIYLSKILVVLSLVFYTSVCVADSLHSVEEDFMKASQQQLQLVDATFAKMKRAFEVRILQALSADQLDLQKQLLVEEAEYLEEILESLEQLDHASDLVEGSNRKLASLPHRFDQDSGQTLLEIRSILKNLKEGVELSEPQHSKTFFKLLNLSGTVLSLVKGEEERIVNSVKVISSEIQGAKDNQKQQLDETKYLQFLDSAIMALKSLQSEINQIGNHLASERNAKALEVKDMDMSQMYQNIFPHGSGVLYENAVNSQAQLHVSAQSATNQGVIQVYSAMSLQQSGEEFLEVAENILQRVRALEKGVK